MEKCEGYMWREVKVVCVYRGEGHMWRNVKVICVQRCGDEDAEVRWWKIDKANAKTALLACHRLS